MLFQQHSRSSTELDNMRALILLTFAVSACSPGTETKVSQDKSFCVDACIRRTLESGNSHGSGNSFNELRAYCEGQSAEHKCCYSYGYHFCGQYPESDRNAK